MARELTGRSVFAITAGAFAVIIGVNIVLAVKAVSTFPGLEVKNSYVASQTFDAERRAQIALGWTLTHSYTDGALRLAFRDRDGLPVIPARIEAVVGRTTEAKDDVQPEFHPTMGDMVANLHLGRGKWMILLRAYAEDGTLFHQRLDLLVR